jgi:hypothetical protein
MEFFMNKKGRETVSCGRPNRKFRGENENAQKCRATYDDCLIESNRLDVMPRHILRRVFQEEIEQGIEDASDRSVSSDRFHLLCRVDPEFKQKVTDRKIFAKACDCGCVSIDRYGRVHYNFLPRSVRRKRHNERVARRDNALKEAAS